ncbi:hypothetical protein [Nonomuraea sp. B19D2]|uniref:hypothetical protein n=1 Tax=Nonomuraea sp. B19D2 TaxID=3159561 RepID=UPI0032DA4042
MSAAAWATARRDGAACPRPWLLAVSNCRLVFTMLASLTVIVLLLLPPARAYFRT